MRHRYAAQCPVFDPSTLPTGRTWGVTARSCWTLRVIAQWEPLPCPVGVDKLTAAELIDRNNRVVARLKFLHPMRAHADMLQFSIGETACFQPEGRPTVTGINAKYNRKTVTVLAENGQQWNVAAVFLRKAESSAQEKPAFAPIVRLPGN